MRLAQTLMGLLLGVATVALTPLASAHMMPPQQGTLNVLGDSVFQVVSVPVSSLHGVDDNGDGRLSEAEVAAHEVELQTQIGARFRVLDAEPSARFQLGSGAKREGRQELVIVRAEHDDGAEPGEPGSASEGPGARQLLVLLKTRFPGPPHALRLETDLFGTAPGEGKLQIRATRGNDAEVAVLEPNAREHAFFLPPQPSSLLGRIATEPWLALALGLVMVVLPATGWWSRRRGWV